MNILISPDSFKGSLDAVEVADVIGDAFHTNYPGASIIKKPMADGGEGTLDALSTSIENEKMLVTATGPIGEELETWYMITKDNVAIIECANIAGLPIVPSEKKNPDFTTTLGIGEVIRHALDQGIRKFLIAIGGSSSNEGGFGMLKALGAEFLNEKKQPVGNYGRDLKTIEHIDLQELDPRIFESNIRIASDVTNPLTGEHGASQVYGPQKGATPSQIADYDYHLEKYSQRLEGVLGKKLAHREGAGAAGGLGFAFMCLESVLESGASLIAEAIQLESFVEKADLVITGEGQSDEQTLQGKAPSYVAALAGKQKVPVFLLSGSLKGDLDILNTTFDACFSITKAPATLEDCISNAESNLHDESSQIARALYVFNKKGGPQ
ncbi:glycerate kinase family protein [Salimicrobium flavidum]|uniref:Glycerate kinase n=1 Tax=Salimicrobium flavidum TaxID=570947 RepID=A0A1N7IZJ0_9BACI|nr:glycerate kinase [Salimicrobium flavidum]SIS42523.1 glycerate kinase [Salimicrobium flavidum]